MEILYILTIISAIIGLLITISIYKDKHKPEPMVCPLGAHCDTVVKSEFSSFFGIGLEVYGGLYYLFIAATYLVFLIFPQVISPLIIFLITGVTITAFLFSLYLIFIQAFYIKSWCSWCLFSAGISTAIFIFTMIGLSISHTSFIPIFIQLKSLILLMHLVGFALGVGAATATDILFTKFLSDFKISEKENKVLKIMSQIIWLGLLLIIISGIGLYLPQAELLNDSAKFLVKMIAVFVIVINGAFLNLFISPKLVTIAWGDTGINVTKTHKLRRLAFAGGSISFISWYTALILGFTKTVPFSFDELLGIYLGVLIIGIVISQIASAVICKSSSTKSV